MTLALFPWLADAGLPTAATPLTDAIAHVESSFGKRMRTGNGQCNGWHMMSRAAWTDVSKSRKARGLPVHPYEDCRDYAVSSLYCYDYLEILKDRLPSEFFAFPANTLQPYVLAAYRGGLGKLKSLNYDLQPYAKYIRAINKHLPSQKPN